jgi:hypothetical protein
MTPRTFIVAQPNNPRVPWQTLTMYTSSASITFSNAPLSTTSFRAARSCTRTAASPRPRHRNNSLPTMLQDAVEIGQPPRTFKADVILAEMCDPGTTYHQSQT